MSTPGMGRGGRSRIVVNVEQPNAEAGGKARGGGRGRRALPIASIVVGAVLLAALLGGYLWWRSYQSRPSYTLALLLDAAQRDDARTFDRYFDTEQVARGFVPQVAEKITGRPLDPRPTPVSRQLEAVMTQLAPRTRDEIMRRLKEPLTRDGGPRSFPILVFGVSRAVENVTVEGDTATVQFTASGRPVDMSMRRDGDRWKVVAIKSDELAADVAAQIGTGLLPGLPAPAPRRAPQTRP